MTTLHDVTTRLKIARSELTQSPGPTRLNLFLGQYDAEKDQNDPNSDKLSQNLSPPPKKKREKSFRVRVS